MHSCFYHRSVVRSTHLSKPLTELRALLASDLSKELLESSGETKSVFEVGAHRGKSSDFQKIVIYGFLYIHIWFNRVIEGDRPRSGMGHFA